MDECSKIKGFLTSRLNLFLLAISALLTIITLCFLASQGPIFSLFQNSLPHEAFYFLYFITTLFTISFIYLDKNKHPWPSVLARMLAVYLPAEILLIYSLQEMPKLTPYVGIASAAYALALGVLIIKQGLLSETPKKENEAETESRLGKLIAAGVIILVMGLNFFFGHYNLGKMAVVDEPLWTFDRIPNFWRDLKERDWRNTNVSDKPGLTVAAISGVGLLSEPYPKQYKKIFWDDKNFNLNASKMESFNIAFRFPILILSILVLPLFYFLIKKLAGKTNALLGTIFIGLSPILIGNSRIINPDSILWIFTSVSLLFFLLYLQKDRRAFLYWSAFFLGLSILTKYTANILYPFFMGLIFVEYIFRHELYADQPIRAYLKKRLLDFAALVLLSFSFIYALYPAIWGKPSRFLMLTIQSQAFEPVWPAFAAILGFIILDFFLLKNFFLQRILQFLVKLRKPLMQFIPAVFILSIAGVFLNVYAGMKFFDFEAILSSPKTSFRGNDYLGFFLTNFYPLVFGISPLAILVLIVFLISVMGKNKFSENNTFAAYYLLLFVLFYYLGSVASEVASTIRYQIIVFPSVLIASGIALGEISKNLVPENNRFSKQISSAIFIAIISVSAISLYQTRPFYMGYASFLLPEKYYLDVKDMGEGSYEAAEYLNSLPDAGHLEIWTDKRGVCTFFVGKCYSSLSPELFSSNVLDYFVISSGRESRTVKMTSKLKIGNKTFQDLYSTQNFTKKIEIAGRPNNYVKIISPEDIQ